MDSTTLLSIIRAHRDDALGVEDGDLSQERAKALDHYHGRPYGNEVEGRSQVVSRDLAETVDWIMPSLMNVFVRSGSLGEFSPVGPEDEQQAQQESDYTNQVIMRDNDGFMVLHDAIKDTLLLKNGYVKHWWDESETVGEVEYTGMSMEEITLEFERLRKQGASVAVVASEPKTIEVPAPVAGPMGVAMQPMPMEVWDIKLKVTRKVQKVLVMATPTEEMRVSKRCRGSLQGSPFTEHVTKKTRSDLIELGMPHDFVYALAAYGETDNSTQKLARDSTDDESETTGGNIGDRSMDEVEFCEAYIRVDWDGDGVAELRKVVTVSGELPPGEKWNEPIEAVPATGFVAKRVPHRHVGESLDDELADLQEIMTVLKRQLLDNIYFNNNSELVVDTDSANLRDFMTSQPGGIKRVKGPVQSAVMQLATQPMADKILPVVDFFERSKHRRSGVSDQNTGLDPDILRDTTKGAYLEGLNRANQKIEMIARMLAETGVKELFLQVHGLLVRHQDKERMVQLRGKWVPVNPAEWQERTNLVAKVGLGTGNEEDKQRKLQSLSALQSGLMQAVGAAPPPVYQRMYSLFEDAAKAMGFDNPEKYAIAPNGQEHQQIVQMAQQNQQKPGGDDLAKAAAIQADADIRVQGARQQAQMQIAFQKEQFEREKADMQARFEALNRDADRRQEMVLAQMEMRSREAIEAMKAEWQAWAKGLRFDMGQPGISAGVQGAPGVAGPMGSMPMQPMQGETHMMPDGSQMAGPMMGNPGAAE